MDDDPVGGSLETVLHSLSDAGTRASGVTALIQQHATPTGNQAYTC